MGLQNLSISLKILSVVALLSALTIGTNLFALNRMAAIDATYRDLLGTDVEAMVGLVLQPGLSGVGSAFPVGTPGALLVSPSPA